jgi:uncharacterized protein YxjI
MFKAFDNRNIRHLQVLRHGWVRPEYELRDDLYSYGKLAIKAISFKKRAIIETADLKWTLRLASVWRSKLEILDTNEQVIGTITTKPFSWKHRLLMNDGFTATFRKTTFWRPLYAWEDEQGSAILRVEGKRFSNTDNVMLEQSNKPLQLMPPLALLGIYLIILRRQREAAS